MGRSANDPGHEKLDRKQMKGILRRLFGYLMRFRGLLLLALLLMLTSNLLALAGPKISGYAIDALSGNGEEHFLFAPLADFCDGVFGAGMLSKVAHYCILLVVFYLVSAILGYLLKILMTVIGQKVTVMLRHEVFHHLTTLPVSYFDTHATGEIISRISYDIDTVSLSLSNDLLQILTSIVTVVGALAMMISISPPLVLVFVVTIPISIAFTRHKTKKIRPLFRRRSGKLGELNGFAEEMLSGQRPIRAYCAEEPVLDRFDEKNRVAVQSYYEADYHGSVIGPSVNFVNNLSLSLIAVFGGILYMLTEVKGPEALLPIFVIALGDVSAFVQYSRKFAGPINEFANILSDLQSAMAAAEKVFRVLDEPSEVKDADDATVLDGVKGGVEIRDLDFGYLPGKQILHRFALSAKPGTVNAIVGPTGAGKTTVINLLMRFYDPDSGTISVDGHENRTVTRDSLRKCYSMVLQDTWLFQGTVHENIAYGKENATREEVTAAAKAAHIHSFIMTLPDGYDTVLTDDGANLSKGQKQMITIARAMLSDAPMLILDEATSNVDSRTEQQIQKAMVNLMRGRTCFVIAHRLSTVQNADQILVLKSGEVIECGTHDSLLRSGGFYSKLYGSQFD